VISVRENDTDSEDLLTIHLYSHHPHNNHKRNYATFENGWKFQPQELFASIFKIAAPSSIPLWENAQSPHMKDTMLLFDAYIDDVADERKKTRKEIETEFDHVREIITSLWRDKVDPICFHGEEYTSQEQIHWIGCYECQEIHKNIRKKSKELFLKD
jgi:hypothetical protein